MTLRRLVASTIVASVAAGCGRVSFDPFAGDASQLVLEPPASTINTGSKAQLRASAGVEPYFYEAVDDGWVDPALGMFVAPTHVGTSTVRVTDASGATATATIEHKGSTAFVVGGFVGATAISNVWSSTDGVAWSLVGALPAGRGNGNLVVYDDRLLYLGGNLNGVAQDTIFASTNGTSWTMVGTLPTGLTSAAVVQHDGALWILGGYNGTSNIDAVFRSSDGVTWSQVGTIPSPRHEHDGVVRDGRLWLFGGHGAIEYADILTSTDGTTWQTNTATLTFPTDYQGFGQLDDLAVRVCGINCSSVEASTDLVSWTPGTLTDGGRDGPTIVALNGQLLLTGGGLTSVRASTDGLAWTTIGTFPATITRSSAAVFTPR